MIARSASFLLVVSALFLGSINNHAQTSNAHAEVWQMQDSGTTAGLRGIDSVDGKIAWASGTDGTVLRTIDGGAHWTKCAVPDGDKDGATLDFRGVQAWDEKTAIVMTSGPGEKSRLYKTSDGCSHWTLLYMNKDKAGFWDSIAFYDRMNGLLLGDPTETLYGWMADDALNASHLEFTVLFTSDGGRSWTRQLYPPRSPLEVGGANDAGAFAASNSSLAVVGQNAWIGAGGKKGASVFVGDSFHVNGPPLSLCDCSPMPPQAIWFTHSETAPLAGGNESSGIFSLHFRNLKQGVSVGGDYTKPNDSAGTAAWSSNGGEHWTASATLPHGYRSTVQWGQSIHAWITAGTNGSDISHDDGKTWQPFDDGNWNALSLPFIVGPKGRIARLNEAALPDAKTAAANAK